MKGALRKNQKNTAYTGKNWPENKILDTWQDFETSQRKPDKTFSIFGIQWVSNLGS